MNFKKIVIFIILFFTTISISFSSLQTNLLKYYPLDSTNQLNSTYGSILTLIPEPFGVVQYPDFINFTIGQDSSVSLPSNAVAFQGPGLTHNWTISEWFFTNDLTNNGYQNLWHQGLTAQGAVIYNGINDKVCIAYGSGIGPQIVCTQSVTGLGTWHNLVTLYSEYNSTHNNWTIYLDNQKNSSLSTIFSQNTGIVNFGDWDRSGNYMLEGGVRDIAIWDRQLSDSEVNQIYTTGGPLNFNTHNTTIKSSFPSLSKSSLSFSIISIISYFLLF